jgi:hypothetical protein
MVTMNNQPTVNAPELYEIRVAGHLSENWETRFEGMSMRHEPDGETVLTGMLDQSAMHGVFVKIRDMGLYLISVNRIGEDTGSQPVDGSWRQS